MKKISVSLVDTEIFFYSSVVRNRTRKGVGKTLVCPFGVTDGVGLEGGSPIERSEASSEIPYLPSKLKGASISTHPSDSHIRASTSAHIELKVLPPSGIRFPYSITNPERVGLS